ncbi:MAG TPA: hypothetical protein VHH11_10100 [Gammaproteobacteria bacterium]|nr:hypothetical protein [Gammaproteobacteria bacterium]
MTREELMELVSKMNDSEKLKVLRLLQIAASCPEAMSVFKDCHGRGLDLDGTLAELFRRLPLT